MDILQKNNCAPFFCSLSYVQIIQMWMSGVWVDSFDKRSFRTIGVLLVEKKVQSNIQSNTSLILHQLDFHTLQTQSMKAKSHWMSDREQIKAEVNRIQFSRTSNSKYSGQQEYMYGWILIHPKPRTSH